VPGDSITAIFLLQEIKQSKSSPGKYEGILPVIDLFLMSVYLKYERLKTDAVVRESTKLNYCTTKLLCILPMKNDNNHSFAL
jgi:hypothetical protein